MRLTEHTFVIRDSAPMDLTACRGCGWPEYYCLCPTDDDDLPAYRGSDPMLYRKDRH